MVSNIFPVGIHLLSYLNKFKQNFKLAKFERDEIGLVKSAHIFVNI